jgi:aminopeptidase N
MEHSSAVAYGSSFPAWCKANEKRDRFAGANRFFDYILIHESAHEWWGNGVSAKSWGHFWIHEGFATYAEGVYVESTQGREAATRYFASIAPRVEKNSRLYRGDHVDSEQAYANVLYYKGACVLRTLRAFVGDDDAWWRALKAFNLEYRYKNADTEDFRAVLERETKTDWKPFFDEWFYGAGYPLTSGRVTANERRIAIDVDVGQSASTEFHLPLDVAWREGGASKRKRVPLEPGHNHAEIECASAPSDIALPSLAEILGKHAVRVE